MTAASTAGAATPAPAPGRGASPATRTAPGAPDPQPGTAPPARASASGPWAGVRTFLRSSFEGTPGRMRALGALAVLAALVFGLAAGYSFRAADGALSRAGANTDQLVRVQAIQTRVIQADADATNAFLVGGLEPAAQRADYASALSSASRLVAAAAQNQPADGRALGVLNEALVDYAAQIEQARANNRQALPIGSQYLKNASADLRADALPALTNLVNANNQRVADELDNAGQAALWLVLFGLLTLVVLVLGLVWLARRTRRYLNLPLAAAAVIVLVTLVVGTLGLASVSGKVDTVRDGAYAATLSTAQARIAGFDAKSNESLALIARGSGAGFEAAWKTSDGVVRRELQRLDANAASDDFAQLPWDTYASVHQRIRSLDDTGNWEGAVALASGTGTESGNAAFADFDTRSDTQLSTLGKRTASQLDDAGGWLGVASVLGLLAGILAAVCAWWGISLRLEEYR
jgi:hypothetical protein